MCTRKSPCENRKRRTIRGITCPCQVIPSPGQQLGVYSSPVRGEGTPVLGSTSILAGGTPVMAERESPVLGTPQKGPAIRGWGIPIKNLEPEAVVPLWKGSGTSGWRRHSGAETGVPPVNMATHPPYLPGAWIPYRILISKSSCCVQMDFFGIWIFPISI